MRRAQQNAQEASGQHRADEGMNAPPRIPIKIKVYLL